MTTESTITTKRGTVAVGAALLLAVWVVPMGLSGTAVALPPISAELGADQTWLQLIVNGFNIAFAVSTLLWGLFSDRFGYRATFRIGVLLYLTAALLTALADSLPIVAAARTLAGIAGAAVFTGAASVISNVFSGRVRSRLFALYGATIGFGLASGPSIAGALITLSGWRMVYLTHATLLVLALAGSLLVPSVHSKNLPHQESGILPLLTNPRFMAMCLVAVAGSIGFVTMLTYLPIAFASTFGLDDGTIGLRMLALTVPVFCGPFVGEWLARRAKRFSAASVIVLGLGLLTIGLSGMLLLSPDRSPALVLIPSLLIGTGFGLSLGLVDGEALDAAPASVSGTAAGILNFFRMGSEAIFVALHGFVIASSVNAQMAGRGGADNVISGQPLFPEVYGAAFILSVCILLGFLITTAPIATILLRRDSQAIEESGVTAE